jgi:O-antigen ligase
MYLAFSLAIVILYYPKWFGHSRFYSVLSWIYILIFLITVFLNSSKAGMITVFVLLPCLLLFRFKEKLNWKGSALLVLALIVLCFGAMKMFPTAFERLRSVIEFSPDKIDRTSSESTAVRYLIWEQCVKLIGDNFIFGVGVGDAHDELQRAYRENGMTGAAAHNLNAHNQFFQTFVGMGLLGFLLLGFMTFYIFIRGILQKNALLAAFGFTVILNFFVESMLQRADGILFFILFYSLLNRKNFLNEIA